MINNISVKDVLGYYYLQQKKSIPNDVTFGLSYLDESKGLGLINNLLHIIHHAHEMDVISKDNIDAFRTARDAYKQDQSTSTMLRLFVAEKRAALEQQKHRWYVDNLAFLLQFQSWEKMTAVAIEQAQSKQTKGIPWITPETAEKRMTQLRDVWFLHAEYAVHRSHQLLFIYDEVLPALEMQLKNGLRELWWNGLFLPSGVRKNMQAVFKRLLKQIKTEKTRMIASMQARLFVAESTGDYYCDDVIKYWRDRIFTLIDDPQRDITAAVAPRRELNLEIYLAFQQRIAESQAVWTIKQEDVALGMEVPMEQAWLHPGEPAIDLGSVSGWSGSLMVPINYIKTIPSWPGLRWLMPVRHFRYHFFRGQRAALLGALRYLPDIQEARISLGMIKNITPYYRLRTQAELVQHELESLAKLDLAGQRGGQALMAFVDSWRELLEQLGKQIAARQIKLLGAILNRYVSRDPQARVDVSLRARVHELVSEIEINCARYGCEAYDYALFKAQQKQVQDLFRHARDMHVVTVDKASVELDSVLMRQANQLAEGNVMEQTELEQFFDGLLAMQRAGEITPTSFLGLSLDTLLKKAASEIRMELARTPLMLDQSAFEQHGDRLCCYLKVWSVVSQYVNPDRYAFNLQDRLYHYAERWIKNEDVLVTRRTSMLEALMIGYGDEWLVSNFKLLQNMRESEQPKLLISAHLKSMEAAISHYFKQDAGQSATTLSYHR